MAAPEFDAAGGEKTRSIARRPGELHQALQRQKGEEKHAAVHAAGSSAGESRVSSISQVSLRSLSGSRFAMCAANALMLAHCMNVASETLRPRSALMRLRASTAIRESNPRL